jgi:hypothetical protein
LKDIPFNDSEVLLPAKNQGDSLAREVTKRKVRLPSDGTEADPTDTYVSQLRTLATNTNPNPQTY